MNMPTKTSTSTSTRRYKVSLGERCILNPGAEPLPISQVHMPLHAKVEWPENAHAHKVQDTVVACVGPLAPYERNATLAETIAAKVEEDSRLVGCPKCGALKGEDCKGTRAHLSHSERWAKGQGR